MFRRVFYGEPDAEREGFPMEDMRLVEIVPSVILLAGIVGLGVYPRPVLASVEPAATGAVERVQGAVTPAPDVEMLDLGKGGDSE